jgi:hypothetical protein
VAALEAFLDAPVQPGAHLHAPVTVAAGAMARSGSVAHPGARHRGAGRAQR